MSASRPTFQFTLLKFTAGRLLSSVKARAKVGQVVALMLVRVTVSPWHTSCCSRENTLSQVERRPRLMRRPDTGLIVAWPNSALERLPVPE